MASIQKRTLDDGSVRWLLQVRKKGFKTVNKTLKTKAAAEKTARRIELQMEDGTWDEFSNQEQKQGNTTLEYFIKRYLEEITPFKAGGNKGIINESSTLNQVLNSPLGKMDVYHIKTGHIIDLRNQWRDKGNKPSTINRKLIHQSPHLSTRQYARIVKSWAKPIGLDPTEYGTHSLRRTKATLIYRGLKTSELFKSFWGIPNLRVQSGTLALRWRMH